MCHVSHMIKIATQPRIVKGTGRYFPVSQTSRLCGSLLTPPHTPSQLARGPFHYVTCDYDIIILINCMEQSPSENRTVSQLVKELLIYVIGSFITSLRTASQLYLYSARLLQSTLSRPSNFRSFLTLFSHPRPGLPSCLFTSVFPTKTMHEVPFSLICATCNLQLILLYLNHR